MKNYQKFGVYDFEEDVEIFGMELNNRQLLDVNGGSCGGSSGGCGGSVGSYSGPGTPPPPPGGDKGSGYSAGECGGRFPPIKGGCGGGNPASYGQCGGFVPSAGCNGATKSPATNSNGEENTADTEQDKPLTLEEILAAYNDPENVKKRKEAQEKWDAWLASRPKDNSDEDDLDSGNWGDITNFDNDKEYMQSYRDDKSDATDDSEMNGDENEYSKVGCKMQGASKIISEILAEDTSISTVNEKCDTNKDGLLTQQEITKYIEGNLDSNKTISIDYWENSLDKKVIDNLSSSDGNSFTYVLGRAENVHGGQHWVVLEGYSVNENGQVQFDYSATSKNDIACGRTYVLGPVLSEQCETYSISKIETYTVSDKNIIK